MESAAKEQTVPVSIQEGMGVLGVRAEMLLPAMGDRAETVGMGPLVTGGVETVAMAVQNTRGMEGVGVVEGMDFRQAVADQEQLLG